MREIWIFSDCNWTRNQNHLILKRALNHLARLTIWLNCVLSTCFCTVYLTVCSCHVTYACKSKSTLYSCLNVKELLPRSRPKIWSLSECNWTRIQNQLILKPTLTHLAKLAKWLNCILSTYLKSAFDSMLLSCHVHFSEWLPKFQGTFCLKHAGTLKFKWLQLDASPEPLNS